MRIGELLRYGKPKDPGPALDGDLKNFWHETHTPGCRLAQLEKGINPIRAVKGPDGMRCPAILIGSSSHKVGSVTTPWQDRFDTDLGRVRYYGDAKVTTSVDASQTPGNRTLLDTLTAHHHPDRSVRLTAPPLVLFRRTAKGAVEFNGVAVMERAERITQLDPTTRRPFTNYVYDLVVLDQSQENEELDWRWISDRRSPTASGRDCLQHAPEAWRTWVTRGSSCLPQIRRSTARLSVIPKSQQLPAPGSPDERFLTELIDFYDHRKHRFEAVAEVVAGRVVASGGGAYHPGWITQRGTDRGIDFVGRLDIATGLAHSPVIVLGQAKCERSVTSGRDLARTIARLQRGWIGCYVTTSFFSPGAQQEMIEDDYPIVKISGGIVVRELLALAFESGVDPMAAVAEIDETYPSRLADRSPREILHL